MRTQILGAATQLFAERGFDGVSLRAIAEAVGIRKASLLYHFPSKEALHRSVLEQLLTHWNEALPRLLEAGTTGGRRFSAVVGEVVRFFMEDTARPRLLLRESLDRPAEMRALFGRYFKPWLALVTEYIRLGQREGIVHSDIDAEAYVLQVFHSITAGVAMLEVFADVLGGAGGGVVSVERHTRELTRIARVSLFLPRPNGPTGGERG
jgi:AcrR family transcriptional regulator